MPSQDETITVIDRLIAEKELAIRKIRKALMELEGELASIRKTRELIGGKPDVAAFPPTVTQSSSQVTGIKDGATSRSNVVVSTPNHLLLKGSLSEMAERVFRAGESLHVDDIWSRLWQAGVRDVGKPSLVSAIVRDIKKGVRFRRVEGKPNTFALLESTDKSQ